MSSFPFNVIYKSKVNNRVMLTQGLSYPLYSHQLNDYYDLYFIAIFVDIVPKMPTYIVKCNWVIRTTGLIYGISVASSQFPYDAGGRCAFVGIST